MILRVLFFAETFWKIACLFFSPSTLQKRKILKTNCKSYSIDFKESGLPLVISFAGLGAHFEFRNSLSTKSINSIFIRDLSHQWYLNELTDIGNGVNEIRHFLNNQIIRMNPAQIIFIGTSAGGFAALLYGTLLKVNKIIVFSPQTFRSKWLCLWNWDYRWLDRVADIYEHPCFDGRFLDVRPYLKNFNGQINVYYGEDNRLDRIHARRIEIGQVNLFALKSKEHNLAGQLRDSRKLNEIIDKMLSF